MSKPIVVKVFRNGGVVDIKQFVHEQQIIIGSSDADTHIKLEGQVSPFHASIERRGEKYILSDLGTPQGTYLKGSKILESALEHGDKIAVGEYILEFYVGAPGVAATTTPAAAQPTTTPATATPVGKTAPQKSAPSVSVSTVDTSMSADTGMETVSPQRPVMKAKTKAKGEKTFATASHYKDLGEFIRPTKGSTIEVLVSWKERVINSYHFHSKGTFYYGSHPSCDIMVPSLTTKVSRAPLLQIDGQASVFIPPGMAGSLVIGNQSVPLTQLYNQGRLQNTGGGGSKLNLAQGEMVRVHLGADVELVVRYCSETPKPIFIPMIDFTSNGFLAFLLAIILAIVVSLYVALNKPEVQEEEDDELRSALIIENPPPPPPPQPVVKVEPPKVEEKKVEPPKPPEPPKKVKQMDKVAEKIQQKVEQKETPKVPVPQKAQNASASGGNNQQKQAMKPNPNKPKDNKPGSIQQGGAKKNAAKDGANANSETKDPSKSGLFSTFGSGGAAQRQNKDYSGGGQLAGLADQSTGTSGFGEDRAGEGLGSKLKETGGGQGKSNVGVSGIGNGKGLGMGTGGGTGQGLGGKGTVTILPGGDAETSGGNIDRDGIRRVFFSNAQAIRACYENSLRGDKGLSGKLVLDFDIGEQGRVLRGDYSRAKSTLVNDELATCIINRMKTWKFPEPPANQTVQVFYPLAFSNK